MKPLNNLSNADRAKLMFQLFPKEMPALIQYTKEQCKNIIDNETSVREQWQPNSIFTFDFWLALVKDAAQKIEKYGDELSKSSHLFSDQLFDGYICLAMCSCVLGHAKKRQRENPDYSVVVNLFFSHKY